MKRYIWILTLLLLAAGAARAQSGCAQIAGHVCFWVEVSTLSPTTPAQGQVGIAYSQTFTATNATSWSIVNGAPPTQNGLTANVGSSFSITGTPTAGGSDTWTIGWVANGGNFQATVQVQVGALVSVTVSPVTVTLNELQTQGFSAQANFSNQTSANVAASWSLTGGAGCAGSTIFSDGLFTAGSTTGACGVQAAFGGMDGAATATVVSNSGPISIQTASLCNAQQYVSYAPAFQHSDLLPSGCSWYLSATGGTTPYTWSIVSGSLPSGLTLTNQTIVTGTGYIYAGIPFGVPTTAGAGSSITFKVTDSNSPTPNTQTVTISSGIAVEAISTVTVNAQSPLNANTSGTLTATGTYADGSTEPLVESQGTFAYASASGQSSSPSTSVQVNTPTATTTGDFAIAAVASYSASSLCSAYTASVTSPNETFVAATTAMGDMSTPPPTYNCIQLFYAYNLTVKAADQPTCNWSIAAGGLCLVRYYHEMPATDPLDQHPTPTEAVTASVCTPNTVTTSQANELIELLCVPNNATTITPPTGFTGTGVGSGPLMVLSDAVVNAVQTNYAPSAAFSPGSQNEVTALATFKANAPPNGTVGFSSNNTSCATVGTNGANLVVTAQPVTTSCTATITAAYTGASPTIVGATVTVVPSTVDTAIIVKPQTASAPINGTVQFTAVGNVTGQTYAASWGSSNPSLAAIGQTSGVATCLGSTGTTPVIISATVSGFTSGQSGGLSCGSSTVTANSCSYGDVGNAFRDLANFPGAVTLAIPSGTCTWTSPWTVYVGPTLGCETPANTDETSTCIVLPNVTSLTIQGATSVSCTGTPGASNYACAATDGTVIEDGINANSSSMLTIIATTAGASIRVTGMTFGPSSSSIPSKNQGLIDFVGYASANLHLDHDHEILQGQAGIEIDGPLAGVADHDTLDLGNATTYSNGIRVFNDLLDAVGNGDGGFMSPTDWGTANFFFMEANQITGGYANDCADAGRVVERYNMFINPQDAMQSHPTKDYAGPERGCRAQEFYHNYISGDSTFTVLGGQGGTWLIWGNTVNSANNTASWFWAGANYRSCPTCNGAPAGAFPPSGWGQCGTDMNYPSTPGTDSPWDGNLIATTGYPCLDNLGRGQQTDAMNGANFPSRIDTVTGTQSWPHQYLEPIYLFDNALPSGLYTQEILNQDYTTTINRDIYGDNTSCAGSGCSSLSTGTGWGTLAQRPTSCTAGSGGTYFTSPTGSYGVAYWATDANGGQGELYVCTATNTWTGIYSPYTYPHPLDTGP